MLFLSDLAPESAAYYGNRAACHMMLSQHSKALDDAKLSVQLDASFVKGYIRITKCCISLGDIVSAKQVS
jgi:DnaJ family protein C protein 7